MFCHETNAGLSQQDFLEERIPFPPLPILFAKGVDHPLRARFEELRPNAGTNPQILEEAQGILIHCGAVSYCFYQLLNRHETAKGILADLPLERRDILENRFSRMSRGLSFSFSRKWIRRISWSCCNASRVHDDANYVLANGFNAKPH